VDLALETERNQPRQQAGMVDVGVGEDDEIDAARIEVKGAVVFGARLAAALEHPAIHQKTHAVGFQQIAGTGHLACRAEKSQFHSGLPSPVSSYVLPSRIARKRDDG
jgi:hypothetical protein